VGYSLRDLLSTCNAVIVYTVSSPRSDEIKAAFDLFSAELLTDDPNESDSKEPKSLRLTIVGLEADASASIPRRGFLKKPGAGAVQG
jgi:hypothetical protein